MGEWQPIETAPRDGTWFLIGRKGEGPNSYEVGCYDPLIHNKYLPVDGELFRKEEEEIYEWRGFSNFERATHWQPLPEPPDA